MFLDAYYKMRYLEILARSLFGTNGSSNPTDISSMGLVRSTGEAHNDFYPGYGATNVQYNYHPGFRCCFTPIYNGMKSQDATLPCKENHYSNLAVGTGTTAPTPKDYRLESEIIQGLTSLSTNYICDMQEHFLRLTKTMHNSGQESITVTEMGLFWPVLTGYKDAVSSQLLVYREVLENPITVAPGESFTVCVSCQFPKG